MLSRTKRQLKGTPPSVDLKESAAQVHFATGFGMHFGSWTIDLNVNPRVFLNGPHVVTGKETDPFAFDAALHYAW